MATTATKTLTHNNVTIRHPIMDGKTAGLLLFVTRCKYMYVCMNIMYVSMCLGKSWVGGSVVAEINHFAQNVRVWQLLLPPMPFDDCRWLCAHQNWWGTSCMRKEALFCCFAACCLLHANGEVAPTDDIAFDCCSFIVAIVVVVVVVLHHCQACRMHGVSCCCLFVWCWLTDCRLLIGVVDVDVAWLSV